MTMNPPSVIAFTAMNSPMTTSIYGESIKFLECEPGFAEDYLRTQWPMMEKRTDMAHFSSATGKNRSQ